MRQKFVCGLITAVFLLMVISCSVSTKTMDAGETAVSSAMELENLGAAPEITNDEWQTLSLQVLNGTRISRV